jgi:hypothetical protein
MTAIDRRMAFKNAFIRHYRNELDRSEACIGKLIDILGDKDLAEDKQIEAILDRLIKHYDRK